MIRYFWIFFLTSVITVLVQASRPALDPTRFSVDVTSGYSAVLPCTVKHLDETDRSVMVLWIGPNDNVLSHGKQVATVDQRISIHRPYPNDWNLHIRNVKYSDRGEYKCKLTTNPPQSRTAQLNVNVSPKIIESPTDADFRIRELTDLILKCDVTGVPKPKVTWFRKTKRTPNVKEDLGEGESLTIFNITREEAGIYECVANNFVPPAATKPIHVNVEFPPNVSARTNRIIQSRGKNTVLECTITAFPTKEEAWVFNGQELMKATWKYTPDIIQRDERTSLLTLDIIGLEEGDFGEYICSAKNEFGEASAVVVLEEFKVTVPPKPTTTTSTTKATTTVSSTQLEETMTTTATGSSAEQPTSSNQIFTTRSHGNVVIENGNDTWKDPGYSVEDSNVMKDGSFSGSDQLAYTGTMAIWSVLVAFVL